MDKIWIQGLSEEMNVLAAFQWLAPEAGTAEIAVAAATSFQVYADGRLCGAGPRRTAKGSSHINRYAVDLCAGQAVTVLVASYRNNSYYLVNEPPFFACQVLLNGKTYRSGDFSAYHLTQKVQKLVRFSFQRNFAECYRLDGDPLSFLQGRHALSPRPCEEVAGNRLTESDVPYPSLGKLLPAAVLEGGRVEKLEDYFRSDISYQLYLGRIFPKSEYQVDLIDEALRIGYVPGTASAALSDGYLLYDFAENRSGYLTLTLSAETDCEIYLLFDEILYPEIRENAETGKYFAGEALPLVFFRMGTVNVVKYSLKPGEYHLTSLEPYTLRYLKVCAFGKCRIAEAGMYLYENPEAWRIRFEVEDATLQKVFRAAQNTFAQNAVDVLTDCPSRERAGWLCDSYFTAQTEQLLTGSNKVERNFLDCFLDFPRIPELPEAMLPECYPADHDDGSYIPNWAMFYVLELEDYLRRTGDRELVDAARDRVYRLADHLLTYRNESGLLERLEKWVFVEWSRSNDLVQDLNYPSNMLFARMCKAIGNLYGDNAYLYLFARMRETIIAESWNGTFFEDRRVRENGVLKRDPESTETCQYYAFYMDIATPERFPELYARMFNEFGPRRDVKTCWPEVAKSNAFIGNYLRLDYLFRMGRVRQVVEECGEYFGFMADRTMTLWEHDAPGASCNHGFASYTARWIVAAVTGFMGFDPVAKKIFLTEPAVKRAYRADIPVGDDFLRMTDAGSVTVPTGYRIERI